MSSGIITPTAWDQDTRSLVLSPGCAYQRLTNLPDNWLRVRIALVVSFTDVSGLAGPVIGENPDGGVGPIMQPWIGLTNGVGMPGSVGCRFVGSGMHGRDSGRPCTLLASGGKWYMGFGGSSGSGIRNACVISDGAVINRAGDDSVNSDTAAVWFDPASSSAYCYGYMIELVAASNGTMKRLHNAVSGVSGSLSSLSSALTLSVVNANPASAAGGWWNNSTVFCGCKHLFIRWPFLNNRLRIHALKVMQLA